MTVKITMDEIILESMHGVILNGETIIPASIDLIALVRKETVIPETGEKRVVFYARKAYCVIEDVDVEEYFSITEMETLFKIEGGAQTTQEMASRLSHRLNIPYVGKHCIIIDTPLKFFHSKNINGYDFTLFDMDEFAQYLQSELNK